MREQTRTKCEVVVESKCASVELKVKLNVKDEDEDRVVDFH